MRYLLSDALLAQLRTAGRRLPADATVSDQETFLLDPGLGPVLYLTADGRVLRDGRGWDDEPVREATPDEATIALVLGADAPMPSL